MGPWWGRASEYSLEFRGQALEVIRATDKPIAEVAGDLLINDMALGNWICLQPRGGTSTGVVQAALLPTGSRVAGAGRREQR